MENFVLWALGGAAASAAGGLIWGIRLEGLVKQNSRDIDRIDEAHRNLVTKHENLAQKIMEKFSAVVEALARIEEKLRSKQVRRGE